MLTLESISQIESRLEITIPEGVKARLANNPFRDQSKFHLVYTYILDDAGEIVELNHEIRSRAFGGKPWPSKYFVFGHLRRQHFYFINTESKNPEIIFSFSMEKDFDPSRIASLKVNDNFDKFVKITMMLQDAAE